MFTTLCSALALAAAATFSTADEPGAARHDQRPSATTRAQLKRLIERHPRLARHWRTARADRWRERLDAGRAQAGEARPRGPRTDRQDTARSRRRRAI